MKEKKEDFEFYFHHNPFLKSRECEMENEVLEDLIIAKKSAIEINEVTVFGEMKNLAKYWGFEIDLCEPGLTERIVGAVHEIEFDFLIPQVGSGVGNDQIAYFVDLFLTYRLHERMKRNEDESFRNFSSRICAEIKKIDPDFWVPAADNGQLGVFVDFCHGHNLWKKFRDIRFDKIK